MTDLLNRLFRSKFLLFAISLNILVILFVYQSVFKLELEGDTWQYAWSYISAYGNTLFNQDSWRNLHTSLAGSYLTFALIKDLFGLNAIAYYTISIILKILTVITFLFLVKKLTKNLFASLVGSLLLSVSFAGVEATHWVFNMYAYIGLIFIMISLIKGLDLPTSYSFRKWLISFIFACLGVWYATMRTNGIIIIILVWSAVKFFQLHSVSSKKNLVSWLVGFATFLLVDKFLLGQMESDYSQKYIIGQGIQAFQIWISNSKYDFLLSSASNFGVTILPDRSWYGLNFPKVFSFLGGSIVRNVIFPSLMIFSIFSWTLTSLISKDNVKRLLIKPKFLVLVSFGLYWSGLIYFISKLGPLNFSAWESVVYALFGGYLMILSLVLAISKEVQTNLRDLFGLTFLWSFVFLLLPLFMNGGQVFGTYHRYMVTTAPALPMMIVGLISLGYKQRNILFNSLTFLLIVFVFFAHAGQTKAFFDRKALVHNQALADKVWQQFTTVVPNKPEYAKKNPPTLWFESADNLLDRETLFETLYFGFLFKTSIKYGWDPQYGASLYYENYKDLLDYMEKNPQKIDDLYGVRMENQSVTSITEKLKDKVTRDLAIQKKP